jgi:hypothetical protein
MNDWIHTKRGVRLVEGTLPKLARLVEALTVELKRANDLADAKGDSQEPEKQLTFPDFRPDGEDS